MRHCATFGQRRALVGFSGDAGVWWLGLLKPGFCHCAVAIDDGQGGFIFYNPLFSATELARISGGEQTALAQMQRGGFRVMATTTNDMPERPLAPMPYNCVEGVKRALGINAPWVLTPWQLYSHLKKNSEI